MRCWMWCRMRSRMHCWEWCLVSCWMWCRMWSRVCCGVWSRMHCWKWCWMWCGMHCREWCLVCCRMNSGEWCLVWCGMWCWMCCGSWCLNVCHWSCSGNTVCGWTDWILDWFGCLVSQWTCCGVWKFGNWCGPVSVFCWIGNFRCAIAGRNNDWLGWNTLGSSWLLVLVTACLGGCHGENTNDHAIIDGGNITAFVVVGDKFLLITCGPFVDCVFNRCEIDITVQHNFMSWAITEGCSVAASAVSGIAVLVWIENTLLDCIVNNFLSSEATQMAPPPLARNLVLYWSSARFVFPLMD